MKKRIFVIILMLVIATQHLLAQEFSKHSIITGLGLELLDSRTFEADGFGFRIGYQRQLTKEDWIRLTPYISYGTYTTRLTEDVDDIYCNMMSACFSVQATLLKLQWFSFFLGVSGSFNHARGLIGTGAEFGSRSSHFERDNYLGTGIECALRINPHKSPVAVNFIPFTYTWGTNDYGNGGARLEVQVKLLTCCSSSSRSI